AQVDDAHATATAKKQQSTTAQENAPEYVKVGLPSLSSTMSKGKVVSWRKQVGDEVIKGDLLCDIQTDDSVMAFETTEEGFLAKIILPGGSGAVSIGEPLCVICKKKEDISAFAEPILAKITTSTHHPTSVPTTSAATTVNNNSVSTHTEIPSTTSASKSSVSQASAQTGPNSRSVLDNSVSSSIDAKSQAEKLNAARMLATPYARKLATDLGINLSEIRGSGPDGRILAVDVEEARQNKASAASNDKKVKDNATPKKPGTVRKQALPENLKYKDIPLSNMRETIAKRLLFSKQNVPHYYLTSEIKMDELIKIRAKLNEDLKIQGIKVSVNDFIVKACALACLDVPEVNSFFLEKEKVIRQHLTVDISVAVKTQTGLITPIVYDADAKVCIFCFFEFIKGLTQISAEIKQLVQKANSNKLMPKEYMGGTFTVSNLGMFGSIHHFSAIINPPQSCILAVGGSERKLVPDNENGFKAVTTMFVTMSCDHRVVDGAVGAVWLKHFKEYMEKPEKMLM
ncbi:unnamed protein product, partial [Thelazia callipaeda]|uniref:Acetyltransferase component of pyruvate dehydrogenase complex n=1 Tax=Thelazia callipaeda TaxID=103827 RepID=A0A0N5D9Q8_THECL